MDGYAGSTGQYYLLLRRTRRSVYPLPPLLLTSGVLGGIRGYTPYTNLRVFLTAYTHLSDHK